MTGSPPPPWVEALRRFTQRHGWRAYAIPVLAVVTVVALSNVAGGSHSSSGQTALTAAVPAAGTGGPESHATNSVKVEVSKHAEELDSEQLPPGAPYAEHGDGTFRVVAGTSAVTGSGPLRRYVIDVENGVSGVDLTTFAGVVQSTLADRRSWTGNHAVSLQRVADPAQADFHLSLTSSMTVRQYCGYERKIETSCWEADHGPSRVNLNIARWVRGDTSFGQDLGTYHLYMINHEVGHALGHMHSYRCLPTGQAPVMMQQTITLKENNGKGPKICQPNAWPFPAGVDPRVAVST